MDIELLPAPVQQSDILSTLAEIGVIITATSVSIKVAALQEMGKLKTDTGVQVTQQ